MSRKTFVVFGLLIVFLAVLIPWLVFRADGDADTGAKEVAANLETGQSLFETNCGACHALYAAGTDGNFGPNLDELLAPNGLPEEEEGVEDGSAEDTIKATKTRVAGAIEDGVDSSAPGRMPGGILSGEQAKEVAEFVAQTAGAG